eukprot:TRINITY_DN79_c3_g1_i2.p1 TRINITY_DN79_c3_g1~~TRINITY_DN79_c3_g1_i2.p1  ORF type:complete len:328 (+),score=173.06 TRINITY_DN79_c3_g1_i2:55-1038(+)
MNRILIINIICFLLFNLSLISCASNFRIVSKFESSLRSWKEVPPAQLSAHEGEATFEYNNQTKELSWNVQHTIWDSIGASINGPATVDVSGQEIISIENSESPIKGTSKLNNDAESALFNGLLYINVKSESYPNGDIRGQLIRSKSFFQATLISTEEIPSITNSTAVGTASFTYDHEKRTLTYVVQHNVTNATTAHIHAPALPGELGNISATFPNVRSPIQGNFIINDALEGYLFEGLAYVNVMSRTWPLGELRGQVSEREPTAAEIDPDDGSSLEGWEIALIVIGCLLAVVLIAFAVLFFIQKQKLSKKPSQSVNNPVMKEPLLEA